MLKDALQAAKARRVVLGNPRLADVRDRAVVNLKADADCFARNVAPIIREIQSSGVALHRGIARSLNARGVATARGGQWTAVQVGAIMQRVRAGEVVGVGPARNLRIRQIRENGCADRIDEACGDDIAGKCRSRHRNAGWTIV